MEAADVDVRDAALADLDASTVYAILALRAQVFVVEQACVYLDPDGRDLQPGARQLWVERAGEVVAVARLLIDGNGDDNGAARIGRVATRRDARGQRLAEALVRRAVELAGDRQVVLDAQSYLQAWYARLGFVRDGADFVEDGIAHTPMRRRPA